MRSVSSGPRVALSAALLGLIAIAGTKVLQLFLTDGWRPHHPAPASLRAVLGVLWAVVQLSVLAGAYARSPRLFGGLLAGGGVIGLASMTAGRSGLSPAAWAVWLLCSLVVIVIGAAAVRLAQLDNSETREIRLFLAGGAAVGAVYLYSARLADGLAQIGAVAAAVLILSVLAAQRERLKLVIGFLQRQNPSVVGALLWIAALLLLALNLAVKSARGAATPQVGPIAPYQIAAVLILAASAIARATRVPLFSRAGVFHAASLAICLVLMFKTDAGTLALTLLGLAIVFAVLGEAVSLFIVIGVCVAALAFARSPLAPQFVNLFSARVADRISGWSGHSRPNDQMVRAGETIELAGWTGQAGAARPLVMIGTEASRDFMPAVIASQGGVAGMLIASAFMLCFVTEFLRRLHRVAGTLPRAMCASLFAAFASNILIATLWIDHSTPLAGIPAPLLARAGSHLTAAALVVGIVAFGTRPEGGSVGNRLAA